MSDEKNADVTPVAKSRSPHYLVWGTGLFCVGLLGVACAVFYSMNGSLQKQVVALQSQTMQAQTTLNDLQARVSSTSTDTASSTGVDATQVSLPATATAGDAAHLSVAEAQYLVNLANDHLQLTHNPEMALVLLQRASQVLSTVASPSVSGLMQTLAQNIATLTASPTADMNAVYTQLTAINADFDRMPLPFNPLKDNADADTDKVNVDGLPWWKAEWRRTMHTLGKVVIVRYNGGDAPPLVLPEERVFIYQNLHAQMENAMWAVLNRNEGIYQASLNRMIAWITQYFDTKNETTVTVLQQLKALAAQPIAAPTLNLAPTLEQFSSYFKQNADVKAAQS